jgi:hypothetical protein
VSAGIALMGVGALITMIGLIVFLIGFLRP